MPLRLLAMGCLSPPLVNKLYVLPRYRNSHPSGIPTVLAHPLCSPSSLSPLGHYETDLPRGLEFPNAFRRMNDVIPFKLAFLLEISDFWEARREPEKALGEVTVRGLLGFLDSPPTIR